MGIAPWKAVAAIPAAGAVGMGATFALVPHQKKHPKSPAMIALTGVTATAMIGGMLVGAHTANEWTGLAIAGAGMGLVGGHAFGLGVVATLMMAHPPSEPQQ